jgi:tetratricopeptide (TPR) repeat protein
MHEHLGRLLQELGELDCAIKAFKTAIALDNDKKLEVAYKHLGIVLHLSGDPLGAIQAHKQALEVHPNCPVTYLSLGTAYGLAGQIENSVLATERSLALAPQDPSANYNLGINLFHSQSWAGAIVHFRAALAQDSTSVYNSSCDQAEGGCTTTLYNAADCFCNLGNALMYEKEFTEALVAINHALDLDPKHIYALLVRGRLLSVRGDHDESISAFQNILEFYPDDQGHVRLCLGNTYMNTGDLSNAQSM